MILNKNWFLNAAKLVGLNFQRKMSVSEATQMMSLLRFSSNKMRELRRVLKNTNIGNFIPSESKIRKEQSELTSYLPEDHFEFGKMKK